MKQQPAGYSKEPLDIFEKWWQQQSSKIEISDVSVPVKIAPPREDETPRFQPTLWPVPPENPKENPSEYTQFALSLGAVDAGIIPATDISTPPTRTAIHSYGVDGHKSPVRYQ